jgi:hypothetical protein
MLCLGSLPRRHIPVYDVSRPTIDLSSPPDLWLSLTLLINADNHKPELSSETAPATAKIKAADKDGSFNLTFNDKGEQYSYNGVRTTKDGNYVLIFDPERQVFVLHRLDSLFHMNLTKTPGNSDVESLQKQFPQLGVEPPASGKPADDKGDIKENIKASSKDAGSTKKPAARAKANSALRKNTTSKQSQQQRKAPPKKAAAAAPTSMPATSGPSTATTSTSSSGRKNAASSSSTVKSEPQPTSQSANVNNKKRNKSPDPEEEEDDDDGGLILEFPGGHQPRAAPKYVAPTAFSRRFSDFVNSGDDDDANDEDPEQGGASFRDADADAEEDDDDLDISVLNNYKPAPAPQAAQPQTMSFAFEGSDNATPQADASQDDGGFDDADIEAELEAEFEAEFEKDDGHDSESDVSEED